MGLTSFPSTSTAGSAKTGPTTNNSNIILVDTHHVSGSSPGHSAGRIWADSTTSPHTVKVSDGSSWYVIGDMEVRGNRDYGGFEIQNVALEALATGSLSTTEARLQWDTTLNLVAWGDGSDTFYAAKTNIDASTYIGIDLPLVAGIVDGPATNPTAQVKNEVSGWLFDATGEELCLVAVVPNGWTGANDLTLQLRWALNAGGMSGDCDWSCDWASLTPDTAADVLNKTETAATTATTTPSTYTDGTTHTTNITIDYNDATNPVAVNDTLRMVIGLANVTGVTAVHLYSARLLVPAFNFDA